MKWYTRAKQDRHAQGLVVDEETGYGAQQETEMTGCYSLGLSHYSRRLHRHRRTAGWALAVAVGVLWIWLGWMIGGAV